MLKTACNSTVDASRRELTSHGTAAFPIACYEDDLLAEVVPWHWHEELEAGIILEGTALFSIGHEKYTVTAGEGFFINSGVLHGVCSADGEPCLLRSFVFHSRLVGGSQDSIFHRKYLLPLTEAPTLEWFRLTPGSPWHEQALDAISQSWSICVREEDGYEFLTRDSLSRLVFQLCRHIPETDTGPSSKNLRDSERIKKMLSCIHSRYGESLTIAAIAASAAVSESECLRCFRGTIGTSPVRYLKQYRLRQAASQLLASGDRISDIANRCGFSDLSYFTKAFRESYGCTPGEYRKE